MDDESKLLTSETNKIEELQQQQQQQAKTIIITKKQDNTVISFFKCVVNTTRVIGLVFWYIFRSFCSKIYTRQKVIRNQFVLITGSGGYLGRQLACELSKHGVSLILWDSNEEQNQKTYEALRALGHRRIYLHKVDLTNEQQVRECAQKCKDKHGYISMIFLAAAVPCDLKTIIEKDENEAQQEYHDRLLVKSFRLFYESNLWLYQEFLPKMIEKNAGHLVLISSEAVLYNFPLVSTYSSLQQAQIKLIECVSAELNGGNKRNDIKHSIVYVGRLKKSIVKEIEVRYHGGGVNQMLNDKYEIDSQVAAKQIIKSVLKNEQTIYLPRNLAFISIVKSLLPTKCFDLLYNARNFMDTETLVNYTAEKKNK